MEVWNLSPRLLSRLAVKQRFTVETVYMSPMIITATPICKELRLDTRDCPVLWSVLFQHACIVQLKCCSHLLGFDSLPTKPFWSFAMTMRDGWLDNELAERLLKAHGCKGCYSDGWGTFGESQIFMGSQDAPLEPVRGGIVWSVGQPDVGHNKA